MISTDTIDFCLPTFFAEHKILTTGALSRLHGARHSVPATIADSRLGTKAHIWHAIDLMPPSQGALPGQALSTSVLAHLYTEEMLVPPQQQATVGNRRRRDDAFVHRVLAQ
jgi:hypothetical protein